MAKPKKNNGAAKREPAAARNKFEPRLPGETLDRSAEVLASAIEAISHPLYLVNARDHSITMANGAARGLRQDGLGAGDARAASGRQQADMQGAVEAVKRTRASATIEQVLRDDQGLEIRWVEIQAFPIFRKRTLEQVLVMACDITARKRAESEEVKARREAERANKVKSDFLAAMSHDLRTPLNGIIGYSEAILSGIVQTACDERTLEYIRNIHIAGTHLRSLIADVLDLSALEARKLELQEEELHPAAIANECLRLTSPLAQQHGVEIGVAVAKGLPMLHADARRVTQVLVNLIGNALKFSPEGGMVTLSGGLDREGRLVFAVADQGPGMDPSQVDAAMEPFGRIHNMTSRSKEGTGLGLPIAKGLVEAHGGMLTIDSSPGAGTVVSVRFPPSRTVVAGDSS